ncbi:MAG: thiamine pyrophosphate-binding protein [Burkholderiales bacterium]|nr:thiamine pyrophosphate-binding protein [Burkholderiales bacterium]
MGQITVARAIATTLERAGTEVFFGVNGHGNWALLDALVHETRIRGIPARAEDQAVQMADGYWRMRRRAPLAVVTTSVGPGNMNIVPAVATAFYESVALLVLAGAGATHWFDRGGMEESYRHGPEDWVSVLKPITKKALLVTRPDTALDMVLRAYHTAISGRPGPVVVQLPFDIQNTPVSDALPDAAPWTRWHPPAPDPDGIREAAELLASAARPLIVAGSGVHSARAWDALLALAEAAGIPVATTATGKGAFPESHRLSLGCIGRAGTGHANAAARRCDVLVGAGTHFTDIDTGGWTLFDIPRRTRLVHIDIDVMELNRAYPAAVALTSDARLGLAALGEAARNAGARERADWLKEIARERESWERSVAGDRRSSRSPLHYARICTDTAAVVAGFDPQMPVFFDTGHLLSFAPPFLTASSRHVAHDGFFHRMGWSASAIIGASIAQGDRPALALIGDGSFIMGGTAVATAVEQNLPLTWVVLNNGSLQIERELMIRLYGRESFCDYRRKGSTALWSPDFRKWAEAMGAAALHVDRPGDYAPALRRALHARAPTVIDVEVALDVEGYRSIWYPYPANFHEPWVPGPLPAGGAEPER